MRTCIATRQLSLRMSVKRSISCFEKPSLWITFICFANVDLPASPVPSDNNINGGGFPRLRKPAHADVEEFGKG